MLMNVKALIKGFFFQESLQICSLSNMIFRDFTFVLSLLRRARVLQSGISFFHVNNLFTEWSKLEMISLGCSLTIQISLRLQNTCRLNCHIVELFVYCKQVKS